MSESAKWITTLMISILTGVTAYQFKRVDDLEARQYAQALEVGKVYASKMELKESIEASNKRTDERIAALALLIDSKTENILIAIEKMEDKVH